MASIGSSISKVSASLTGATSVVQFNHTTDVSADTENSLAITGQVRFILIRTRGNGANLRYAFVSGETATNYVTLPQNAVREINGISLADPTIFFRSDATAQVVEVEIGLE